MVPAVNLDFRSAPPPTSASLFQAAKLIPSGRQEAPQQADGVRRFTASWQAQPCCSPSPCGHGAAGPGQREERWFGSRWWPVVGSVERSPGGRIPLHQSYGIRINDCCSIPGLRCLHSALTISSISKYTLEPYFLAPIFICLWIS